MKQDVLDVLVYLFQNYINDEAEVDADRDSVHTELLEAGFPNAEVEKALAWLDDLASEDQPPTTLEAERSIRIFAAEERAKVSPEALGFLMDLERSGILAIEGREIIMNRVMTLDTEQIDVEELKWLILMALFNQPGQEEAYAWVEDLVFDSEGGYLH